MTTRRVKSKSIFDCDNGIGEYTPASLTPSTSRLIVNSRSSQTRVIPCQLNSVIGTILLLGFLHWSRVDRLIYDFPIFHSYHQPVGSVYLETSAIDAVVYIVAGSASTSDLLGWSIESVIERGGWHGPIYVISDDSSSTQQSLASAIGFLPQLVILNMTQSPSLPRARAAKLTKTSILKMLPEEITTPLYLDTDIIVGFSLQSFAKNLEYTWASSSVGSFAMFDDRASFTLGYCDGCNTWHTGIISMKRGRSEACLDAWHEALESSDFDTKDQAALDEAIAKNPICDGVRSLDTATHLRMMKDLPVVRGLIRVKTFNHFTGSFRSLKPEHQHSYYRDLVPLLTKHTSRLDEIFSHNVSSQVQRH